MQNVADGGFMLTELQTENSEVVDAKKFPFPKYPEERRRFAIKTAIALSIDIEEADSYVCEFSQVTEEKVSSSEARAFLKTYFLKDLFGLTRSMAAAFSGEIHIRENRAEDDYKALLAVILELKWG
jgi:hypothetical protein